MPPDDEDSPTPKDSGTLAVFEQTCVEALGKLDALPVSEASVDLRREAIALAAMFRSWTTHSPQPAERAAAVTRLMDLHRAVAELASLTR